MVRHPNSTDKHVGSRVRMRRLMLGFSQTKLAEALGIAFQQVQKYEKGANRISASRLQQIASVLQVPISFFFEGLSASHNTANGKRSTATSPELSAFLATSDGLALIKAYTRIRRRHLKRVIVDLVEDLAAR